MCITFAHTTLSSHVSYADTSASHDDDDDDDADADDAMIS